MIPEYIIDCVCIKEGTMDIITACYLPERHGLYFGFSLKTVCSKERERKRRRMFIYTCIIIASSLRYSHGRVCMPQNRLQNMYETNMKYCNKTRFRLMGSMAGIPFLMCHCFNSIEVINRETWHRLLGLQVQVGFRNIVM